MKKLNNKGFTLLEVLAVIVIIAIVGGIAVPNVLNIISNSDKASYNIMVSDIKTAATTLYDEIDNNPSNKLYQYDNNGKTASEITIENNTITINLQTLVSNGFISGTRPSDTNRNKNPKGLKNPKTNIDIGNCSITITKNVDSNYKVTYTITNNSTSNQDCPNEY